MCAFITAESLEGLPYAVSMAREYQAHLVLLHVIRQLKKEEILGELSASDAIYYLGQLVPTDAGLCHRPELEVKYGAPAQDIIDTSADAAPISTHVGRTIAQEVGAPASSDRSRLESRL